MDRSARLFLAGHRGLVGSAILRALEKAGFSRLILRTHAELDLRDQAQVQTFFQAERPEVVVIAAAKVGGIGANSRYPAEFLYDNLMIETNLIHGSYQVGVQKLLFLGSSCIYPRLAPQPLKEEYLLSGSLEATNEAYAIAKIAGIKLCQAYQQQYGCRFISAMPTNLYGPGDNFDLETSHVLPALIRRFHEAKASGVEEVVLWGTGSPRREFLFVDDLAEACLFLLDHYEDPQIINVGTGEEQTIRERAETVARIVGFSGRIAFD
ncbi:MAG: GDP-L-fucose synthase, partial [Coprothermobacterota bacterium]|nr:GDP-L-fucose synthase [Coprothermobacterota bacterium]